MTTESRTATTATANTTTSTQKSNIPVESPSQQTHTDVRIADRQSNESQPLKKTRSGNYTKNRSRHRETHNTHQPTHTLTTRPQPDV